MSVMLEFLRKSTKTMLIYRLNFLGTLLVVGAVYTFKLVFVDSLYQYSDSLGGWSPIEVQFLILTMMVVLLITDIFDSSILRFFQKLYFGESEVFFIKPTGLYQYLFFAWAKISSLIILIFVVCGGIYYFQGKLAFSPMGMFAFYLISIAISVSINLLFIANLSFMAVYTKRLIPSDFIFSEVSKLMIIPNSLFGGRVGHGLAILVPTIFTASIPASIFLSKPDSWFGFQVAGLCLMLAIFGFNYFYTSRRFEGLGG